MKRNDDMKDKMERHKGKQDKQSEIRRIEARIKRCKAKGPAAGAQLASLYALLHHVRSTRRD